MSGPSSGVKVAVRCRPLNSREIARGAKPLIRMQGNQTMLDPPDSDSKDPGNAKVHSARSHSFAFDYSYCTAIDWGLQEVG
jgi:kinesin family protein 1